MSNREQLLCGNFIDFAHLSSRCTQSFSPFPVAWSQHPPAAHSHIKPRLSLLNPSVYIYWPLCRYLLPDCPWCHCFNKYFFMFLMYKWDQLNFHMYLVQFLCAEMWNSTQLRLDHNWDHFKSTMKVFEEWSDMQLPSRAVINQQNVTNCLRSPDWPLSMCKYYPGVHTVSWNLWACKRRRILLLG